jgi:hypothetical protein
MIAGTKEPSDGGIQASSRTLSKITTDQKQVWPNDTLDTTTHSVKRHGNVKRDSHSEHHLVKAYIASLFFNAIGTIRWKLERNLFRGIYMYSKYY